MKQLKIYINIYIVNANIIIITINNKECNKVYKICSKRAGKKNISYKIAPNVNKNNLELLYFFINLKVYQKRQTYLKVVQCTL